MGLFRKGNPPIIAKFLRTDLDICSHSRERKTRLIADCPNKYGIIHLKFSDMLQISIPLCQLKKSFSFFTLMVLTESLQIWEYS